MVDDRVAGRGAPKGDKYACPVCGKSLVRESAPVCPQHNVKMVPVG